MHNLPHPIHDRLPANHWPASSPRVHPATLSRTCPRASRPSMSASRVETMELWIWSCLLLRTCREYTTG